MLTEDPQTSRPLEPWTLPDSICVFRMVGSVALVGLAVINVPYWFVGFYLVLAVSDLVDGPIARALKQQTRFGAKLDSLADIILSGSLLIGVAILNGSVLVQEIWFVLGAVFSYLGAAGFGYWKFGKFPSYHTWTAKLTHLLTVIAGICLVLDWSVVPLRVAAISVMIANFESLLISVRAKEWLSDVPSVFLMHKKRDQNDA